MLAAENYMSPVSLPFRYDGEAQIRDFEDFLGSPHISRLEGVKKDGDVEAMHEVTMRIREQLRFIIHSLRCWRERHETYDNDTRLRYSAYEGALCYSDLRRHWMYYRHAMKEMNEK